MKWKRIISGLLAAAAFALIGGTVFAENLTPSDTVTPSDHPAKTEAATEEPAVIAEQEEVTVSEKVIDASETASGTCGNAVTWRFDQTTGTLTLSGSGKMYSYYWEDVPWKDYQSAIKQVKFSGNITSIGDCAFSDCKNLTGIALPSGVTSIGYEAFYNCTSLPNVTLPSGVTSIGEYAFYDCEKLTSVSLPASLTSIGDSAFYYCESLKSITIPKNVSSIGSRAFGYCRSLTAVTVDSANRYYASKDGVLFDKSMTTLLQYPSARSSNRCYTLPGSVKEIGNAAFYGVSLDIFITNAQLVIPDNSSVFYYGTTLHAPVGSTAETYAGKYSCADFKDSSKDKNVSLATLLDGKKEVSEVVASDEKGGVYLLHDTGSGLIVYFLKMSTGKAELTAVYRQYAWYRVGSKVYLLQQKSSDNKVTVEVFNLNGSLYTPERSVSFTTTNDVSDDALGVDAQERLYLLSEDGKTIYLYSKNGAFLSKVSSEEKIYDFVGFDSTNGNFYVKSYYNWYYWGYDHAMHVVRMGSVLNNSLVFNDSYIDVVCQQYWYERNRQIELLDNRYLTIDSTYSSRLILYDSNDLKVSQDMNHQVIWSIGSTGQSFTPSTLDNVLAVKRDNGDNFDEYAACGTRAVALPASGTIVTWKDNKTLAEYRLSDGKECSHTATAYPVYALVKYKTGIVAIEKNGDKFTFQYFAWKKATNLTITGAAAMSVGKSLQLGTQSDATVTTDITWKSSNPKIVSVNQDGTLFAWATGKAVITAESADGLKASCEISVTSNPLESVPGQVTLTTTGKTGSNLSDNNYTVWSSVMNSYLCENADGTLCRVENTGSGVLVETYQSNAKSPKSTRTLTKELPIFGGFFSGKNHYYLVFGKKNDAESDSNEVIRVVKYDKNWNRVAALPIKGANTYIPFDAGCLRMEEYNGKLYLYTCHEMYATESDSRHHQANLIFVINQSSMAVEDSYYKVMNIAQAGYVSHSFNQFIKTDGQFVYRVDHGDAGPRAISIVRSAIGGKISDVRYTLPISLSKVNGYNPTGASVGGFELSSHGCVIAGNAVDYTVSNQSYSAQRNIFLSFTDKNLSSTKNIWVTKYTDAGSVTVRTPQLVKLGANSFLIMWEEVNKTTDKVTTRMMTFDEDGNFTSSIAASPARLSDCQPILCKSGLVKWYTADNAAPSIYTVNPYALFTIGRTISSVTVSKKPAQLSYTVGETFNASGMPPSSTP